MRYWSPRPGSRRIMLLVGLTTAMLASLPLLVAGLAQRGLIRLIDVDRPGILFLDWRLDLLSKSRVVCHDALGTPNFRARPVDDKPITGGCGWANAVLVSGAGGAEITPVTLNCGTAAALAMWVTQDVQSYAQQLLGSRVARVQHVGGYSCRDIKDSSDTGNGQRSEHATANAIDVTSFTLQDGRSVSIVDDWRGTGPKAQFLRRAFLASCKYFRISLGPEYNTDHADHFHFDRGPPDDCP